MLYLLAQAQSEQPVAQPTGQPAEEQALGPISQLFESVTNAFSRWDALAHPDVLLDNLSTLGTVWSIVFLIGGILCMLNGYKFQKLTTTLVALVLGAFGGYVIAGQILGPDAAQGSAAFIVAGLLSMLLAVLVFPMMKAAVLLFGALAGAFVGANLWTAIGHAVNTTENMVMPPEQYWIGLAMGAILCGMMAWMVSDKTIEMFSSVGGSTLMICGGVALLLSFDEVRQPVVDTLSAHAMIVPLLVIVPAVIAFVFQATWQKQAKQPSK